MNSATPQSRIEALTGLRFLAAMAVYLHHHPKPDYLPDWMITFFSAGYNGVTIFFVLSGFVLGINYFELLVKPNSVRLFRYFVARFVRVYPLYALVLLFVWLDRGAPLSKEIILHFLTLQTWVPDIGIAYGFNGPGWSIGVEFFLYACFPVLVIFVHPFSRHPKRLWLSAFVVLFILAGAALYFQLSGRSALAIEDPESAHRWLYRMPLTRLGDFFLGLIAALLFKNAGLPKIITQRSIWSIVSYLAIGGIIVLMLYPANLNSAFSWDAAYASGAFFLILGLALAPQTTIARFLGSHWLVLLGEASYALYLIHFTFIRVFNIARYEEFDPWIAIPLWSIFAGICILFSIGLNIYIEKPIRSAINNWANPNVAQQ